MSERQSGGSCSRHGLGFCEDPGMRRDLSVLQTLHRGEDTLSEFGNKFRLAICRSNLEELFINVWLMSLGINV